MWTSQRPILIYNGKSGICIFGFLFFVLWNSELIQCSGEEVYLTIPALGRTAHLGYLYDAVKDEIIEMSVFRDNTVDKSLFVETTQTPHYSTTSDIINSYTDIFRLFKIDPSSAVNILSELTTPEGSSSLLIDAKSNFWTPSGVLLCKYKSVVENLQIFSDHVKNLYHHDVLLNKRATHIVTGITWGHNVAVKFDFQVENQNLDFQNEETNIIWRAKLENVTKSISEGSPSFGVNTLISLFADISSQTNTNLMYKSPMEIQKLLKAMPLVIQEANGGKGIPVEIKLTPISVLRNYVNVTIERKAVLQYIHELILKDFVEIFDEMASSERKLNNLHQTLKSQSNCIMLEKIDKLNDIQTKFLKFVATLRSDFRIALSEVRSGWSTAEIFSNLTQYYYGSEFCHKNLINILREFSGDIQKIAFCTNLQNTYPSVEYFGFKENLNERILQQLQNIPIYILFHTSEDQSEAYQEVFNTFFHTLNKPQNTLFLVDCDFSHLYCNTINKTVIKQMINGKFTIQDVHKELETSTRLELLERNAIGQYAEIGEFYDAKTDSFLGTSILSPELIKSLITKSALNVTEIVDIPSDSYVDMFKAFNLDPELQFSLLAGLVPFVQDGHYILQFEDKQNFRFSQYSNMSELNIPEAIKERSLQESIFKSRSATHFVYKIIYGTFKVFAFKEKAGVNTSDFNANSAKRLLQGLVSAHTINWTDDNLLKIQKELEKQYSDIIVYNPIDIETNSAWKATTLGNGEQLLNNGKTDFLHGAQQPLAYILYPIENLRSFGIVLESVPYTTLSSFGEDPADYADIIYNIDKTSEDIKNLNQELKENAECITDNDFKTINSFTEEFKSKVFMFKETFKKTVVQIREGAMEVNEIKKLKQEFMDLDYFGGDRKYKKLKQISFIQKKINLCKRVKSFKRITYLGRETAKLYFSDIFTEEGSEFSKMYTLYYKPEWVDEMEVDWYRSTQLFFGKLNIGEDAKDSKLFFINCEFNHSHCHNLTQPTIYEYKNGRLTSKNFIQSVDDEEMELGKRLENLEKSFESNHKVIKELQAEMQSWRLEQNNVEQVVRKNAENISLVSTAIENSKSISKMLEEDVQLKNEIESLTTKQREIKTVVDATNNDVRILQTSSGLNKQSIETLTTRQNEIQNTIEVNKNSIGGVISSTNENRNNIQTNKNAISGVLISTTSTRNDIQTLTTKQNDIQNAILANKNSISGVLNSTNENRKNIETNKYATSAVLNSTNANLNNILSLQRQGVYFNSSIIKNAEDIKHFKDGLNGVNKSMSKVFSYLGEYTSTILNCGGRIALQSRGSKMMLKYKVVEAYSNNERCLWIFDYQNSDFIRRKQTFKLKMIWDGFPESHDAIFALRWNRDTGLTSTRIVGDTIYDFSDEALFLSFSSDGSVVGTGFVITAELTNYETPEGFRGVTNHQTPSSGNLVYGTYQNNDLICVAINPSRSVTFTVDNANMENNSECTYDYLKIFQIGPLGNISVKKLLCGVWTSSPFSYTTADPTLAIFSSDGSNTGSGFKLSWS